MGREEDDLNQGLKKIEVKEKSWRENEILVAQIRKKSVEIQNRMVALVHEWNEFETLLHKTYHSMPETDASLFDSPLSPARMAMSMRQNFAKLGFKWAGSLPFGPERVKNFSEEVETACTWGTRLLKDQERQKKIEAAKARVEKAKNDMSSIL